MSKPSIILIPGSFSLPKFYDNVAEPVAAQRYEIRAIHLPSVGLAAGIGRPGDPPTMYEDAAFIAGEVSKLADEGKDVILIPHSYAGTPTTESIKGLSKKERQKEGKEGGVVRIAYMTALVPSVGMAPMGVLADMPKEQQIPLEIDDPAVTAPKVFSALPAEEGVARVKEFAQHSAISFTGELTYAGNKDVPVSYLFCEDNLTIPAKNQRAGIDVIEEVNGRKVDVTSIKTGHCPTVSAPQVVIDWILDVARKA